MFTCTAFTDCCYSSKDIVYLHVLCLQTSVIHQKVLWFHVLTFKNSAIIREVLCVYMYCVYKTAIIRLNILCVYVSCVSRLCFIIHKNIFNFHVYCSCLLGIT
jgi:hypothetical protein